MVVYLFGIRRAAVCKVPTLLLVDFSLPLAEGDGQLKSYRSHLVARASRPSKHGRDAHATWYV